MSAAGGSARVTRGRSSTIMRSICFRNCWRAGCRSRGGRQVRHLEGPRRAHSPRRELNTPPGSRAVRLNRDDLCNMELKGRRELFCREYLKDLHGTNSGYALPESDARTYASKLLAEQEITDRIAELAQARNQKLEISAEVVLIELLRMLTSDAALAYNENDGTDDMVRFYADPLGFVMYAYPWDTDPTLQVASSSSPGARATGASTAPTSGRASSSRSSAPRCASAASTAKHAVDADSRGDRERATASARARSSRGSWTGSCRRARTARARSPRTPRRSSRRRPGRRSSSGRRSASPRTGSTSPRARAR
jgi:hypothetical protein